MANLRPNAWNATAREKHFVMTEPCTPFEERAAILQYLAGYPRPVAEAMAREQLAARERAQFDMFADALGGRGRR